MDEPTAAAIAYGFDKTNQAAQTVLVFDFGGGTLDVSILKINNGIFKVIATDGDTHLGGEDLDNILVDQCILDFEFKSGIDLNQREV